MTTRTIREQKERRSLKPSTLVAPTSELNKGVCHLRKTKKMNTRIYLIRHGETIWSQERRVQGRQDSPLTVRGESDALVTGLRLLQELQGQPIPRCISSPLGRCRRTAALVCGILEIDLAEVEFDERLSEQSCGDWEGRTIPEIESCAAERFEARALNPWQVAAPNGESYAMVAERLRSWLSDIEGQNVIAVSHSHASRVLRAVYADLPQLAIDSPTDSPDDIHVLSNGRIETLHCM